MHSTGKPDSPIYCCFLIYFFFFSPSYDDDVSTTATSSLSSLPTVTIMSQAPSTTVTGAPALKTPVGAIVGSIAGGITLLALVLFLLFCWHRRRHQEKRKMEIVGNNMIFPEISLDFLEFPISMYFLFLSSLFRNPQEILGNFRKLGV